MGLFTGIKKVFGKTIGIGAKQEGQLVYMYPLKRGRLKMTTEIEVKPGFVAVILHYDTVCDILTEGKYKCASGQMPKLNKYVKPKLTFRGYIAPKTVVADDTPKVVVEQFLKAANEDFDFDKVKELVVAEMHEIGRAHV